MDESFNPYREWLDIADDVLPRDHYRLLGVDPLEADPQTITGACERRKAQVRSHRPGPRAREWKSLLDELDAARLCLVDRDSRARYDAELQSRVVTPITPAPVAPTPIVDTAPPASAAPMATLLGPVPHVPTRAPRPIPLGPIRVQSPSENVSPAPEYRKPRQESSPVVVTSVVVGGVILVAAFAAVMASRSQVPSAPRVASVKDAPSGAPLSEAELEGRPEPRSYPTPSINTEPKPKPKPAPEPKPEPETKVEPEPKSMPTPETPATPTAEPEPQPAPTLLLDPAPEAKPQPTPEPESKPLPPPEPESKPEPKPEPKPVAVPEPKRVDEAAVRKALAQARKLLAERDPAAANGLLEKAAAEALETPLEAEVERYRTLAEAVEKFWAAVRDGIKALTVGEELLIQNTRVAVVTTTSDSLTIHVTGQNRRYTLKTMPTGLSVTLAQRWFDENAPTTKVFIGAFLLVDPNGDRQEVQRLWEEAALAGADLQDLMALLDDKAIKSN